MVDNCFLVGFALVRRDALLARFLLFGAVVGFAELPADAWLVDYTHTLDYSIGGGPMIWRSPLWMPLAWEVVAVQFGNIGLRLWERLGKMGLLMIGLLGAINIPFYEEMARRIHWWYYSGCRMISFYSVVHHSRRVRYCARVCVACANSATRHLARSCYCWNRRWIIDLCLLRPRVLDYGSIARIGANGYAMRAGGTGHVPFVVGKRLGLAVYNLRHRNRVIIRPIRKFTKIRPDFVDTPTPVICLSKKVAASCSSAAIPIAALMRKTKRKN